LSGPNSFVGVLLYTVTLIHSFVELTMSTSPVPTGNVLSPISPNGTAAAGGGGGGGGGMDELLPLVLQLTNPDQVGRN